MKWQIERLDEAGMHIRTEAEGVSRPPPGTWASRAGVNMMRARTAAFSCGVALKAILMTRNDRARMTHDLRALYVAQVDCTARGLDEVTGSLKLLPPEQFLADGRARMTVDDDSIPDAARVVVRILHERLMDRLTSRGACSSESASSGGASPSDLTVPRSGPSRIARWSG